MTFVFCLSSVLTYVIAGCGPLTHQDAQLYYSPVLTWAKAPDKSNLIIFAPWINTSQPPYIDYYYSQVSSIYCTVYSPNHKYHSTSQA